MRLQKWLQGLNNINAKIAIIEMGAGTAVPTVRLQSQRVHNGKNSILIRINPRDYDAPTGAISIPLGALEGVNSILD
jgi:hypothetical protein